MIKKLKPVLVSVIIILIAALFYAAFLYLESEKESGDRGVVISIPPGATLHDIQTQLEGKGVLKHSKIFRWAAYLTREEKNIKVGKYIFKRGESVFSILERLSRGLAEYKRIMIPEGFMVREIASLLYRETAIDSTVFEKVVRDSLFIEELGFKAKSLEGYLFPDTYLISWPYSARGIARQMAERFNSVYSKEIANSADSLSVTRND
ncbi:endolytic transglycosylase MltG, partial [bacterium]|nr:endolytic transglycosylase MltG [bacterium]